MVIRQNSLLSKKSNNTLLTYLVLSSPPEWEEQVGRPQGPESIQLRHIEQSAFLYTSVASAWQAHTHQFTFIWTETCMLLAWAIFPNQAVSTSGYCIDNLWLLCTWVSMLPWLLNWPHWPQLTHNDAQTSHQPWWK